MINTTFMFDGQKSTDYGLHNVTIDTGLRSVPMVGGKDILEDKVRDRRNPYYQGVQHQPMQFTLYFSLLDERMTREKKNEILRWLFKDDYREFRTTDDISKCLYVIATNQIDFETADSELGYFRVDFRASTSHWISSPYIRTYDLSDNETSTIIEYENLSNVGTYYSPEIEFELVSDSKSITLINLDDGGREFTFTDLWEKEKIYVDNDMQTIISDNLAFPSRLNNFNKKWLRLRYGINRIEVIGKCKLEIRSVFPVYA